MYLEYTTELTETKKKGDVVNNVIKWKAENFPNERSYPAKKHLSTLRLVKVKGNYKPQLQPQQLLQKLQQLQLRNQTTTTTTTPEPTTTTTTTPEPTTTTTTTPEPTTTTTYNSGK